MILNPTNIANSLNINGQIPLDAKTFFLTLAEMSNLGTGSVKAFTYYEGMPAYCNENKKKYIWREVREEESDDNPGLIAGHYTYPAGVSSKGINYSGRTFNFFQSDEITLQEFQTILQSVLVQVIGFSKLVPVADIEEYETIAASQDYDENAFYLIPCDPQP